jgi:hypothetical protein
MAMAARTTAVVSFAICFIFGVGCSWRGAVANGGGGVNSRVILAMQIDDRRTPAEIILAPDPSCEFRPPQLKRE